MKFIASLGLRLAAFAYVASRVMALEGATRADTWAVSLFIEGIDFGLFDVKEGGDVDSEETKYKPGGMRPPVTLGGSRTTENVTIRRNYRLGRDHIESDRLFNWAGNANCEVHQQPLDHDGNAWGKPIIYRGKLKRFSPPDHDSNSNDAAMLEIEISIDGYPTGMPRP